MTCGWIIWYLLAFKALVFCHVLHFWGSFQLIVLNVLLIKWAFAHNLSLVHATNVDLFKNGLLDIVILRIVAHPSFFDFWIVKRSNIWLWHFWDPISVACLRHLSEITVLASLTSLTIFQRRLLGLVQIISSLRAPWNRLLGDQILCVLHVLEGLVLGSRFSIGWNCLFYGHGVRRFWGFLGTSFWFYRIGLPLLAFRLFTADRDVWNIWNGLF